MSDQADAESNLIPIETIDAIDVEDDPSIVPQALVDDPVAGDGSAGRDGVEISEWRLHKLGEDRLMSVSDPEWEDRKSRKKRRAHKASRHARTEKGRTSRGRIRVVVGFLLAAVVAGVAWAGISYALEHWGGKTIPYVVGLTQVSATEQIEAKGLVVTTETVPSDTVDGRVVGIDPAEGTRVEEGSEVHLVIGVSRTIPEVVGMSREDARATLEAAGAENIRFQTQIASAEEDKVLEVIPAAGAVFMSSDEVIVKISQRPRMLDVTGQEEEIAVMHLEHEGITTHVETERSDAEHRLRVIRTSPAAGEPVGDEGATVYVGDALIDPLRVEDYFDASGPHIEEFLTEEGFIGKVGYRTQNNHLKVRFANEAQVSISFVAEPWAHAIDQEQSGYYGALDESADIEGVRLTIPLAKIEPQKTQKTDSQGNSTEVSVDTAVPTEAVPGFEDPTVGEETAKKLMELCGLEGMLDSCTQANIVLPTGTSATGHVFYCCNGESAHNVWTIFIRGTSTNGKLAATEAVVTAAPKATYASIDLTKHGSKVCDYVAYQEEYR